jgi:predicted GNAT superfamily acetyltransferase
VALQKEVWGYSDLEVYPLRLFVNLGRIGGHVLGAFAAHGQLVGFVASLPAWREGERYYHSLSLGVLPAHENRGLGRALKLAQREHALGEGVERIEWTFDPLRVKNAFFNIARLGAICRRYLADYYGPVDSRLQHGLPSDRLVAEWWLESSRVGRALAGKPPRAARKKPAAEILIPGDIESLKKSRPSEAQAVQAAVRAQFEKHFAHQLAVTGFVLEGTKARYLLDPYED